MRIVFAVGLVMVMGRPLWGVQRALSLEQLQAKAVADSNDPVAHYQLAMGYWDKKRWDDAERSLQVATSLSPSYAEAWLALGILPEARGEGWQRSFRHDHGDAGFDSVMQQAELFSRRAFLSNPMVDLAILGRFRVPPPVVTADGRMRVYRWWQGDFEKGVNNLRQSNNEVAYQQLEKILSDERAGNDGASIPWMILWHHGIASARTGRFENAIRDFAYLTGRARAREGREIDRGEVFLTMLGVQTDAGLDAHTNEFRYMLGMLYFLGGSLPEATAVFQRVLEFDVGFYQANIQLARMYEARQMWDAAIQERRNAIATNPDDPSLLIDLGATLVRAGKLDEAGETLEQAVAMTPRDPRAPFTQALVAQQRSDTATMKTAYSHFLSIAPSSWGSQITDARARLAALGH
ncbi:MAG: tetratricopeptide repeat protein [Gemmatimonadota bacterium]